MLNRHLCFKGTYYIWSFRCKCKQPFNQTSPLGALCASICRHKKVTSLTGIFSLLNFPSVVKNFRHLLLFFSRSSGTCQVILSVKFFSSFFHLWRSVEAFLCTLVIQYSLQSILDKSDSAFPLLVIFLIASLLKS